MKNNDGTRSQIKNATTVAEINKLYRAAKRKEELGEYDFARPGYMDRLKKLVKKHTAKLVDIEVVQLNMKTRSKK